ncbi:hypothetical protein ABZ249_31430 [Nocardiopsis sp. NPDC006139]|uniref:hypothetical protein n=1 Tax=Nocardiopsis sp. NPDC006139 TaxID=3154578 RepID=UPI0033A60378
MNDPKRQYSTVLMRAPFSGDGHTIVANRMVRDRRLSFKARGILTYLGSHVEGWETSEERLAEESTDKLHAVRSGLAELEEDGYMLRFREILANGTRAGALWIFSDNPATLPGHAQAILDQLATEGRRFTPLNKRTRESMKRRRPTPPDGGVGATEPGCENPILEPGGQNPSSEPTSENRILAPASDFPSLENPMHKNTTFEGEGEEGDARARAGGDPSAADEPVWGVAGGADFVAPSLASANLVREIAGRALLPGEHLSAIDHQRLATLVEAARPLVDAQPGLSWDEYTAWLKQGWVRKDGRRTFTSLPGALGWRLMPDQIQGAAWAWACEQRGAQEASEARGEREAPQGGANVHAGVCGRHKVALTDDGACLWCQQEERAEWERLEAERAAAAAAQDEDQGADPEPKIEELDPALLADMYSSLTGVPATEEYKRLRAEMEAERAAAKATEG